MSTPPRLLIADPERLRELADWLEGESQPELSGAANRAARELDNGPGPETDDGGPTEEPRRDG